MKVVGAVAIKVRPDTRGFRDDADKELRRQLGDRHSVPIKVEADVDDRALKRAMDQHKRRLREHLNDLQGMAKDRPVSIEVDKDSDKGLAPTLANARKEYERHRKYLMGTLKRMEADRSRLRDKALRNESRFQKRMRALAGSERLERGSKIDPDGSFGRLATQLPLVLKRMMRESSEAFMEPTNDFRQLLRKAIREVNAETSRIKANGFTEMRDVLRSLNAELDRPRGMFSFADSLKGSRNLDGLQRKLKDVNGSYVRALKAARDFRSEYNRLDELDRERLRVGFTAKDNAALEQAEERFRRLRGELSQMGSTDLFRFWKAQTDGSREYAAALEEIEQRRRRLSRIQAGWETLDSASVKQSVDNRRLDAEAAAHFRRVREEADRTQEYIDGLTGTMKVELEGTAGAAAHLKWLSRPRTVPLHVRVSATSAVIAEGLLKSFAGINLTHKMGKMLEGALKNFDKFTVGAASVTAAVMSISNAVVAGVGALAGIGKGVAQVFQGLAMGPTILGAVATGLIVATTATKDFFGALKSGDYEGLTENARKTAEALKGTWTELSDTIKENFWDRAGTAMSDFVLKAMPSLARGLGKTASAMGDAWRNVFTAFEHSLDVGYMDRMFEGLAKTTNEVAKAAGPAMRAVMQLGARGAEHLPRLGKWMTRNAEAFEQFIDKADRAGRIDQWINNSIDSMYSLWDVGRGTWRILEGVADAALKAGGPSLRSFADGMMRVGDAFKSVRGQAIMGDIFEGAFEGFGAFMDGFKDVLGSLGRNSGWIKDVEILSGKLTGQILRNLSTIVDNPTFRDGTKTALEDVYLGLIRLRPASDNIAGIIGNLGKLGGAVFKGIAPTIDRVTGLVDLAIDNMVGPLTDAIPTITHGMGAIFNTLRGPVDAVSRVAGGAIKVFNSMPATFQQAAIAAGALLAFTPHIKAFGGAIAERLVPSYTSLGKQADALKQAADESGRPITRATATWRAWKQEMQYTARLMGSREMIRPFRDMEVAAATADRVLSGMGVRTYFYDAHQGATKASDGFRQIGRAAREAGTHLRQVASSIPTMIGLGGAAGESGRRFRIFSSEVSAANKALANPRPFQTFKTGMAEVASGAGAAAKALGKSAGNGLMRAATGLMGALGGPWGLAIAGAAIGLSVWGQKTAEAKEKADRFKSTLDPMTGKVTAQSRAMGAAEASAESFSNGLFTAKKSAIELGQEVGVSSAQMTSAFSGNVESIERTRSAIGRLIEDQRVVGDRGSGMDTNRYATALRALDKELAVKEKLARQAQREAETQAKALGISTARAKVMNDAWNSFGDAVASGNISGQQMISTMDVLTGGHMAAADAAYNLQSSLAVSRQALKEWGAQHAGNMGRVTKNLFDANGAFDMTKQSTRDLYQILRTQVEPAFESVATAFNNAGGGEKGISAARQQMGQVRDDMFKMLTDVEGMSAKSANQVLDNLNIKPDAIELLLDKANFETNVADIARSLQLLTGERKEIDVGINAEEARQGFDGLKTDAQNAQDMLQALTSPIWRASLEADDRISPIVGQIDTEKERLIAQEWLVMLAATDNASGTLQGVRSALDAGFNNKSYRAVLTVLDNATGLSMGVKDRIMAGFVQGNYQAVLKALDQAGPEGERVKDQLDSIFNGKDYQADLNANDNASGDIDKVASSMSKIESKDVSLTIKVSGLSEVGDAERKLSGLKDANAKLNLSVSGLGDVESASNKLKGLKDKPVRVTASVSGAATVADLDRKLQALKPKSVKANVTASGAPGLAKLKSGIDALKSKSVRANVTAAGAPGLSKLKAGIDALRAKTVQAVVNSRGADGLAKLKSGIDKVRSKTERVTATATGHAALRSLQSAINSVRGKTVTVNVRTVKSTIENANGNIVESFANGGVRRERHVAQIAPAGTYRLWAEQETGGEAYIPLAKAKRARSEKILSEVAHRFGGEFRKFANGSDHSRAVAVGGDSYNINISTLPNDQADRVANDTLFALKHLRRGGGAGVRA